MSNRITALLLLLALLTGCQASVGQPAGGPGTSGPTETAAPAPGSATEQGQGEGAPPAEGPTTGHPETPQQADPNAPVSSEGPQGPDTPVTSSGPVESDVPASPGQAGSGAQAGADGAGSQAQSGGGVTVPEVPEGEPSQFVAHGDRSCSMVALTYDAGSGADGAKAILDMLEKYGLKVTFFLTGRWAEQFPDLAKRIADEGHEIANHSYSHPDLTTIPDEEVLQQIKDGEEAIRKATGKDPRPLFREPYGAFNDHERLLVRQAGYSYSIYWDLDTLDWQFPGIETTVERLLRAQPGSIVLMHLNVPDSAAASDRAIPVLQERGYEIVPVSRLIQCTATADVAG